MSELPAAIVVDANIVLKLILPQQDSSLSQRLFDRVVSKSEPRCHVPDFFYAECASVLVQQVRISKLLPAEAEQGLKSILALKLIVTPDVEPAASALEIGLTYRLNGYDAHYVALSRRIRATLVTADQGLVRATAKVYDVQLLTDYMAKL